MAIVKLYDIDEAKLSKWALKNCPSFCGWILYENYDAFGFVNLDEGQDWMVRYEFEFGDEQDAFIFQLRWEGQ